ncbi:cation-translocating P-type ATPase [Halomonas almeriensis]|uniref:heavy metal translocating P-type ATPase n=1 Tax=Halomonas almeriensis TaxID=308163 RepID=UPI0025B4A159|nr:cation-translocating P-type ATPase [Halomonas almeriensis]MDN3552074.1 cation-translocating P-type ATPase [Halomonas almeriensis]
MSDDTSPQDGCCSGHQAEPGETANAPADSDTLRLRIQEMDCPTEEALLRKALTSAPGVAALEFDLMGRVLSIHHHDADTEALQARVRDLGMTPRPLEVDDDSSDAPPASDDTPWGRLILAALLALAAEIVGWTPWLWTDWLSPLLALPAIALVGLPTWRKGWVAIRHRTLNINALMSVAVTGAILIGHWSEAAMVMVLFTLAERIEAGSLERARRAIRDLLDSAPRQARRRTAAGDWESVAAEDVAIGEVVRILPGERLPLDGEVVRGHPSLDESPITGESLPVDKAPGDSVFAGAINHDGDFDIRTTREASDTTLARIIHAVEQAQASQAPTQRFIDRFAAVYTPVVFVLAILTALTWPWLVGGAWLDGIYRALVLLVIACPCALVISTPVTIVSGLSAAARAGILIKGGRFLEQGRRLTWLALDKTGTLTQGEPALEHWEVLGDTSAAHRQNLARQAALLAGRSTHPVSAAIQRALAEDSHDGRVDDLRERPGQGVEGQLDGQALWLGNRRLADARGLLDATLAERLEALERHGASVVALGSADRVMALFTVRDPLKPSSLAAIQALHRLGVKTLMLSGDNRHAVAAIAAEAGIDSARGELLPEDKLTIIEEHSHHGVTGMVGDGINDAPALAHADIGFSMGAAGSDVAIETADVALMDDDLGKLPSFLRLARTTHRVLIQNIVLALGIKAVFLVLAFSGQATLWMAVFADLGSSLLVIGNGLRLLRHRD